MHTNGKVTAAERAEVVRLLGEGVSYRRIADQVFGHSRFRGRVERIRRALQGESPPADGVVFPPLEIEGMTTTEVIRVLFERRLAMWAASDRAPSPRELRGLLDMDRRLEAAESVERQRPRPTRRLGD